MSSYMNGHYAKRNKKSLEILSFQKAADGNRTRDLRTTNATLYRLSHSSLGCMCSYITEVYCITVKNALSTIEYTI